MLLGLILDDNFNLMLLFLLFLKVMGVDVGVFSIKILFELFVSV